MPVTDTDIPQGQIECPICGMGTPHHHSVTVVEIERYARPAFESYARAHIRNVGQTGLYGIASFDPDTFNARDLVTPGVYRDHEVQVAWNAFREAWMISGRHLRVPLAAPVETEYLWPGDNKTETERRALLACRGLEKIATGSTGERDNWETAQVMRSIARETLKEVRYGEHAELEREQEAREECARRGLNPDDYAADGVLVWMVVGQELRMRSSSMTRPDRETHTPHERKAGA